MDFLSTFIVIAQAFEETQNDYGRHKSFTWIDYVILFGSFWFVWMYFERRRKTRTLGKQIRLILSFLVRLFAVENHSEKDGDDDDDDPIPFFQPCPNPNCVRCRTYKKVNQTAQQRLRLLRIDTEGNDPAQRVIDAVRNGPRHYYHDTTKHSHHDEVTMQEKETDGSDKNTGGTFRSPCPGQYPTVLFVPGLPGQPMVTQWHQPICDILESHAEEIWMEYQSVMTRMQNLQNCSSNDDKINNKTERDEPSIPIKISTTTPLEPTVQFLQNDVPAGQWQTLHLFNQGMWQPHILEQFPRTTRILQQAAAEDNTMMMMTDQNCVFGNIFFSVLQPGTVIEPHCGPCNVRHRLHLTLQPSSLPSSEKHDNANMVRPTFYIHGQEPQHPWQIAKRAFVMDDSFVHAVSYQKEANDHEDDTDTTMEWSSSLYGPRVVLILDLWHPQLTRAERQLIAELYQQTNINSNKYEYDDGDDDDDDDDHDDDDQNENDDDS